MAPVKLTTFIHPDEAYRLQYPASWEHVSKDDARSCGFGPRERDDVGLWITILPVSIDTDRIEGHLPELFQQAIGRTQGRNVRRDPTLRHFGLKADITEEGDGGHFWMVTGGDLVLFASSQVPVTERETWNPQFDSLMASLEITRQQELLLRKTSDDVLKRLRELHPDQDYQFEEEAIRGRDQQISLANLYKQVAASPERRGQIIETFVEGLASVTERPLGREKLHQVRGNILPVLKPSAYLKAGTATGRLVATDWIGDVVISYAIRAEKVLRLLTVWDLDRWGMTPNALHQLAIENLTRLPWPERLEGARQFNGRLIIVGANDHFGASRLLHPDLHGLFSEQLGTPFYAGIPNGETLIVFSGSNPSFCNQVLRQIRRDHEVSAHPVTPLPFRVGPHGIALAQLPRYSE
jgi:uncharacterized protein YtpQ (UPF0354 family)